MIVSLGISQNLAIYRSSKSPSGCWPYRHSPSIGSPWVCHTRLGAGQTPPIGGHPWSSNHYRARDCASCRPLLRKGAPVRLASMTLVNDSSLIRMSSPSSVTPALDTSTCTGPCFSSTSVKAASTAAASVTSHRTGRNSPGSPSVGPRWVTAT